MQDYLIVAAGIWFCWFCADSYVVKKPCVSIMAIICSAAWIIFVPLFIVYLFSYYIIETIMIIRDYYE